MKKNLILGRRVVQSGLVIATTLVACTTLQAAEHEDTDKQRGAAKKEHAGKSGEQTVEKFIQKAMASGQMEVQMGQLGQQQGQNQQVKALAAALVKDHTQANQKLQQLASSKSITQDRAGGDHQKHQQHLDKLKGQTGAEFDKEFVRMALKHHKKDISEFEKAQTQLHDSELKSFISETLPKLRQHMQLAQTAAKAVGVDEATIAADVDADHGTAVGGAGGAESGPREKSPIVQDRPRSSVDGPTDRDASVRADAKIGDREVSANAGVDNNDASVQADVETDKDGKKIFQKGDGKVLGLSTDKSDGKFLGVVPNPRKDKEVDADAGAKAEIEVNVDKDDAAVGAAASAESGSAKKDQ